MRVLLLALLALAASAVAAAQAPIPISLPSQVFYSEPGDIAGTEVTVPVLIGASVTSRGIVAADIVVEFNPEVVSLTSVTRGSLVPSGCSFVPGAQAGQINVRIACSSATPLAGGPGTLLTFSGTLTGADAGSTSLTFVDVTPFSRREGTQEINVPVTITNGRVNVVTDPDPKIGAIDNQTMEEDGTRVVQFTLSDQDTPLESITVTAASGSTALVPAAGLAVGLCEGEDAASPCRTLTVSPAPDASGTTTITLTANDNDTRSENTSASFSLTVTPVNDAPRVANAVGDQSAPAGSDPIQIDLANVFTDIDDDDASLQYAAQSGDTETATVTVSGAIATVTPVRMGTAILTLQATDDAGLTGETTFVLSVGFGVATDPDAPAAFATHGSAPNPATSTAHILVDLPTASEVQVEVYDSSGRRVLDASSRLAAGTGLRVPLQLGTLPAGVYVYRVTAEVGGLPQSASGRVVVVR